MSTPNPVPKVDPKTSQHFGNPRVRMIASMLGDQTYTEIFSSKLADYTNRVFVSNTKGQKKLELEEIGPDEANLVRELKNKQASQLPVIDKETMVAVFNIIETAKKNLIGDDFKKLIALKGPGLNEDQIAQIERQTLVGYITRMSALLFPTEGTQTQINKNLNNMLVLSAGEFTRNNISSPDDLYNCMIKKYQESLMTKKINEYFSPNSAYTAQYIIKDLMEDTNYKMLGEGGKQFLQEKIKELSASPKKMALQAEFNKQVLNISSEVQTPQPKSPENTMSKTQPSSVTTKPKAETPQSAFSIRGIWEQFKSAVATVGNEIRERISGKLDKTLTSSQPNKPEASQSTDNAAQTSKESQSVPKTISEMISSAINFFNKALGKKSEAKIEVVKTASIAPTTSSPVTNNPPTKHSTASMFSRFGVSSKDVSNIVVNKSLPDRIKEIEQSISKNIEAMKQQSDNYHSSVFAANIREDIESLHNLKHQSSSVSSTEQALILKSLEKVQSKMEKEIRAAPEDSSYKSIMKNIQQEELFDKGIKPQENKQPNEMKSAVRIALKESTLPVERAASSMRKLS